MKLNGIGGVRSTADIALIHCLEKLLIEAAGDPDLAPHTPEEITAEVVKGILDFAKHFEDGRNIQKYLETWRES